MRCHLFLMSCVVALSLGTGCSNDVPNDLGKIEGDDYEGDEEGECDDEADNDRDGFFDCDDDGCLNSPACEEADADADADADTDSDSDSDGDSGDVTDDSGDVTDDSGSVDTGDTGPIPEDDADGDGMTIEMGDCDDGDATIFLGAPELCDGVDNDCDGETDEEGAVGSSTFYMDGDGDGYGATGTALAACTAPEGYVSNDDDCNDGAAAAFPGGVEICDGLDNDCDGTIDGEGATGIGLYYRDADGDGYGDPSDTIEVCSPPSGYVLNSDDCDDSRADVYLGATEVCDGVDNDCDSSTDEDGATGGSTYYLDADGDGDGTSSSPLESCSTPTGYATTSTDCDDSRTDVYLGAPEVCDDVDNDCDGTIDEPGSVGESVYYLDADGDGRGTSSITLSACELPSGYSTNADDCDDSRTDVYLGATEVCDSVDNDCDGATDEAGSVGSSTYYLDADSDGYGSSGSSLSSCSAPSGYVSDSTDCNDGRSDVYPGATEMCDGVDNDCDGSTDEEGAVGVGTYYLDADSDGYGGSTSVSSCSPPSGYVLTSSDCDDGRSDIYPGATETCDGVDNDCDGATDEAGAVGGSVYYLDSDGDGYGGSTSVSSCSAPSGYVSSSSDCNDGRSDVYPGATEVCDGADNDCDGSTDEAGAVGESTYYFDNDGDGYGGSTSVTSCSAPSGYVSSGSDCCDIDGGAYPGSPSYGTAASACGSFDYDCDGSETPFDTSTASCEPVTCIGSPGWSSGVPGCGESGTYSEECELEWIDIGPFFSAGVEVCLPEFTPRIQECR